MQGTAMLVGYLAVLTSLGVGPGNAPETPLTVNTRVFLLDYAINQAAHPITAVTLWSTTDQGNSWKQLARDDDMRSPIRVEAPSEGLLGIYLIVVNASGPSSLPPTSSTRPHRWIFVDYTPPIVQLHALRTTSSLGRRIVQIRWTAVDAHFGSRPVTIRFNSASDPTWRTAENTPVSNTGQFDWFVPEQLYGTVNVQLVVSDRGGQTVFSEPVSIELLPDFSATAAPRSTFAQAPRTDLGRKAPPARLTAQTYGAFGSPVSQSGTIPIAQRMQVPDAGIVVGSARAQDRTAALYAQAVDHRNQGRYREGIALLRQIVRLNPRAVYAIVEMADMLYRIGDMDRAIEAYELALLQEPGLRVALRGAAISYRQKNDHASASRHLRTILRYNPRDAEVWMNLGDVAIYQGDESLARECYTRATQVDLNATSVITGAQQRLAVMAEVSRRYTLWGP